ncbi:hypothetical protein F4678DRAFT_471837 [Xylaria arbuscula]|nr:hypothetical protein F4678DRAFT_471837 [Xylaria arbuscula]
MSIMDEHHLSLTSPGPSSVHHLERPLNIPFDFTTQAMRAGQQENMNYSAPDVDATGKDPLVRWYEFNDGPWHPPELTSGTGDGSSQSMVSGMRDNRFLAPNRSSMVPSEIIPQSDSGYGSYHNQPSIANGSVCDNSFDTNPDTQSMMGASMIDTHLSVPDVISRNHISLPGSCDSWSGAIRIETVNMTCEECGKACRTKSELKKHDQRHKKPFKCDVENCSRTQGFSTTNDLDRHKRSVHPDSQTFGNRYVCQIGACKSKDKVWPRADNFKAHLKRVHDKETVTEEDLESCIYKPPVSLDEPTNDPPQEAMADLGEYAGLVHGQPNNWPPFVDQAHNARSFGPLSEAQGEIALSLQSSQRHLGNLHVLDTARQQEQYQETVESNPTSYNTMAPSSDMQHNQLSREPEISEPSSSPVQAQLIASPREPSVETQISGMDISELDLSDGPCEYVSRNSPSNDLNDHQVKTDRVGSDSIEPECNSAPATSPSKFDLSKLDLSEMTKLVEVLQSRGEMRNFLEVVESRGLLEQYGCTKTETDAAINTSHYHPCSTCDKTFPRKCELKKHEKRHEKPYGCTMPDCNKRFGSKNDWKRHENTQHFQLEMWGCDEESCEKLCHRREMFRAHLEKDHQIADQTILDAKLEKCRVGRNCEARFWCGFCQKIVEIKQKGQQAWAERFDHIDEHFSGRNDRARKKISEWKSFDLPFSNNEDFGDGDGDDSYPSTKNAKAQRSLSHTKSKRKREDGGNAGNSKRTRVQGQSVVCVSNNEILPILSSSYLPLTASQCHCRDLIMVSQPRCNFPCEHIPCGNCER